MIICNCLKLLICSSWQHSDRTGCVHRLLRCWYTDSHLKYSTVTPGPGYEQGTVHRLTWHSVYATDCNLLPGVFGGLLYLSRCSDSLRNGQSGDRNPVQARFSAQSQTGPGAQPASCAMGTGSFPGVKRPEARCWKPASSSAEV